MPAVRNNPAPSLAAALADTRDALADIDRAPDPRRFVGRLDPIGATTAIRASKRRSYGLLGPRPR